MYRIYIRSPISRGLFHSWTFDPRHIPWRPTVQMKIPICRPSSTLPTYSRASLRHSGMFWNSKDMHTHTRWPNKTSPGTSGKDLTDNRLKSKSSWRDKDRELFVCVIFIYKFSMISNCKNFNTSSVKSIFCNFPFKPRGSHASHVVETNSLLLITYIV